MTAKQLARDPVFVVGFGLRILLILFVVPHVAQIWFFPFIDGTFQHPSIDPWTAHLNAGGSPLSFPYGPVMYVVYLAGGAAGGLVDAIFSSSVFGPIGLGVATSAMDIALLVLLQKMLPNANRQVLYLYWLSPIVLYVAYWHGQLDIVPVTLLVASLYFITRHAPATGGVFVSLAVAAKLSMGLAVPFMLIYFWRNRRLRHLLPRFAGAVIAVSVVLQGPALLSRGFRDMVLGTPEIDRLYSVAISFGDGQLFVVPVALIILTYLAWRLQRMSGDLLLSFLGIAFLVVVALTPAPTGWFLWVVPFLVVHSVRAGPLSIVLVGAFSVVFVGLSLGYATGASIPIAGLDFSRPLLESSSLDGGRLQSIWLSGIAALGLLLAVRFYIYGIQRNDYFRLSRRPIVIGVAGNSGSGKDTFVRSLTELFGAASVSNVSGDDYHKWDREGPMWQALTHLDPKANDLHVFGRDVLALVDGKKIVCRRYDHETGRFTRATSVDHNNVIVVNGLHALYLPLLRERMDLRVFLLPDENLRRHLKTQRDVGERGYDRASVIEALDAREADAKKFVLPQSVDADIIFSLRPERDQDLDAENGEKPRLKLSILLRRALCEEELVRMLIGVCGMRVDVEVGENAGETKLLVEGDVSAADIELAVSKIVPEMGELLTLDPTWHDGMAGVMQLVSITYLSDALRRRFA